MSGKSIPYFLLLGLFSLTRQSRAQTIVLIILANLIPLVGVLFLHWSLSKILWLYGFESILIAIFTLPKIFFSAWKNQNKTNNSRPGLGSAIYITILMIIVSSMFMGGHIFILLPIITALIGDANNHYSDSATDSFFSFIFTQFFEVPANSTFGWEPILFSSFGQSLLVFVYFQFYFLVVFFFRREYRTKNSDFHFRIISMRIVLLQGTLLFSLPVLLLLFWIFPASVAPVLSGIWVSVKIAFEVLFTLNLFSEEKVSSPN